MGAAPIAGRRIDLTLARSFLFLPADRLERLPKALGSGAFRFEGTMVDAPVLARARRHAHDIESELVK